MRRRARFLAALRRVGGAVHLVEEAGETPFTASVQPRPGHRTESAGPLGVGGGRLAWLYSADSAAWRLREGSVVRCGGVLYRVRAAETLELAGEAVYRRAELEATDG